MFNKGDELRVYVLLSYSSVKFQNLRGKLYNPTI
jgi:hypothetical protein